MMEDVKMKSGKAVEISVFVACVKRFPIRSIITAPSIYEAEQSRTMVRKRVRENMPKVDRDKDVRVGLLTRSEYEMLNSQTCPISSWTKEMRRAQNSYARDLQ